MKKIQKITKILIIHALVLTLACTSIFAQEKMYTQDSILSVMGAKHETKITFIMEENEITVLPFSYNDKEIGKFTLSLSECADGKQKGNLSPKMLLSRRSVAKNRFCLMLFRRLWNLTRLTKIAFQNFR